MTEREPSIAAKAARTTNQLALDGYRRQFAQSTKFGADLLAMLERSEAGIWRVERDKDRKDRWWLYVTLPENSANLFDIHLEMLVLYTEYQRLEPRTLAVLQSRLSNMRVDSGVTIVVSLDPDAKQLASRRRGELSIVMMDASTLRDDRRDLRKRIAEVLSTTDHFDVTNPIQEPSGFFGRETEVELLRQSLERGQSVGIFGLRKAGKTSLMNTIQRRREEAGRPVVKIDVSEVASGDDFRLKLLARAWKTMESHVDERGMPRLRLLTSSGEVRFDLPDVRMYWIDDLKRILDRSTQRLELFVDEIDQAYAPRSNLGSHDADELFQCLTQLRGVIQDASSGETRLVLLCAGVDPALFEKPLIGRRDNLIYKLVRLLWLAPMQRDEMAQMVRALGRRMGVRVRDHKAIDLLYAEYGGHPLLSRKACSAAVRGRDPADLPFDISSDRMKQAIALRGESSPFQQAVDVLESFEQWFPEESQVVELLTSAVPGDRELALLMAADDPQVVAHAIAYGLLDQDLSPRIRAALPR